MLKINRIVYSFFAFVLWSSHTCLAQCAEQKEAEAFLLTLRSHHYAPLQDLPENHQRIVEQFLRIADPSRVLYAATDLQELLPRAAHMLDTTGRGVCEFLSFATDLHRQRIQQFRGELQTLTSSTPAFAITDTMHMVEGMQTIQLHSTHADREDFFRRLVSLQYLLKAYANHTSSDLSATDQFLLATNANDAYIRDHIRQSLLCRVIPHDIWKDETAARRAILSHVFEAIALAHDPHTNFFDPSTIEDFISHLQSDQISYGISIGENEQNDKIIQALRPGSTAWRSNQIHVEDKIVGISLDNNPLQGMECMSPEEVENAIHHGDHNTITLDLRSLQGEAFKVTLQPEVAVNEENVLTSMVLQNDGYTVGYIALPSFYTSSYDQVDRGCANEVGKEIMKLKKDSIQGLILDLRFNGGGSVGEAIDLAGLFIDVGPIGLQQTPTGKLTILKEMSKGVVYDGPLIILVNTFSASASELIAGALQDYHRALIVGQNTYGKATSQQITPVLTPEELLKKDSQPVGYLKITNAGLYRITNSTHQNSGVTPDIALPDPLVHLNYHERNELFPIQLPPINKKLIYTAFAPLPVDELQQRHNQRMKESIFYTTLEAHKNVWPQMEYSIALHPNHLLNDLDRLNAYPLLRQDIGKDMKSPFTIAPASANRQLTQMDANLAFWFAEQKNNALIDGELQECFNIAIDLIQITLK